MANSKNKKAEHALERAIARFSKKDWKQYDTEANYGYSEKEFKKDIANMKLALKYLKEGRHDKVHSIHTEKLSNVGQKNFPASYFYKSFSGGGILDKLFKRQ